MTKSAWTLAAAAVLAALIGGASWHHNREALDVSHRLLITHTLEPIAALLTENQTLTHELQSDPFTEPNAGILESYLIKTRRDGVPKHADMKQRLDQIAENNTAIVTLIKAYAPQARTPAFIAGADKFRNYASAWRDRWNSVMELFMAGGNYPATEVPFPKDFPEVVRAEIAENR